VPGESTHYKIKFAQAADEVKAFPGEVSAPGAKTIDEVIYEKILHYGSYAGSAALKSGELALQQKSGSTFTLPSAATVNQIIAVYCSASCTSVKVSTVSGQKIYGDFITGVETVTLLPLQHVLLQSDGTEWLIIAGEPRQEEVYSNQSYGKAEAEAGVEASASRPAFVNLVVVSAVNAAVEAEIEVNGSRAGEVQQSAGGGVSVSRTPCPVWVNPGQKWSLRVGSSNVGAIEAFTVLR
jgi:hypothetical protein